MSLMISPFCGIKMSLGECPQWDEKSASLWALDCRKGEIYQIDSQGHAELRYQAVPPCGSFSLLEDGGVLVAEKEAIVRISPDGERHVIAQMDMSHPDVRFNDGAVIADGSFILGSMHLNRAPGQAPEGGIYRLRPSGEFSKIGLGLGVANGPCLSPKDGRFYICDSTARLIYSYAFDPEKGLSDQRIFASTQEFNSSPDGCAFDDEGGLWTALVHSGALLRLTPEGEVSHHIPLPMAHPTAVSFGGPAMDEIFVTSISDSGRLRAEGPHDGTVLRLSQSGYRGFARPRFQI